MGRAVGRGPWHVVTAVEGLLTSVAECRVLTLDDFAPNTALVRHILNQAGLPGVAELHDSTRLESVMADTDPDLVLLDLRMPDRDGFDVLQAIRRQAAAAYLPVIVVTADSHRDSIERALALGAHDFLTKPFNPTELVLRVRNLLLHRLAYKELRRSRTSLRTRLDVFEPDSTRDSDPAQTRATILDTIADDGIAVALQPIVDMRNGDLLGAEALARFPDGPLGSTAGWFAAARDVDVGADLEIAAACKAARLLPSRPAGTWLSLNFSPATIVSRGRSLLDDGVAWDRVVVELTEHVPVEDYEALNVALQPLRDAGARVAVDDTGAGFASLRHILDLHPDVIKIDIGITRGVDRDRSRAAIAGMLVGFADKIGICVVAEGVETEAERATLVELGAVLGQGYLLGRPEVAA